MSFESPSIPQPAAPPTAPTQASFISRGSTDPRRRVGRPPLINTSVIGTSSTTARPSLLGG